MGVQGVGGSRDQRPRDIFEEYVMTMKSCFFFFLATPCSLWDFSSLTRGRTHALSSESTDSLPLDCQGIPWKGFHKAKDEGEINVHRDMVCKGVYKQCQMSI